MMKKHLFILTAILSCILYFQADAHAVTISAAPNPANVSQTVGVSVYATFPGSVIGTNCTLEVNFGDGPAWTNLAVCTALSCLRNINHAYTTPGSYTITARPVGGCRPFPFPPVTATTNITVRCPSFAITSPPTLPQATEGTAYPYQIRASGGQTPYTYTIVSGSLPPGLSMNTSGAISGTPTAAGTYNFRVRATDNCATGSQTARQSFSITVFPAPCPILSIISPAMLTAGTTGQPYTYQVLTSGGEPPVSFNIASGALPPGLTMNSSGLISGTPASAGSYNFVVATQDSCGAGMQVAQKSFSMTINLPPCASLAISSPSVLTAGNMGQPYTYMIQTSGGEPPITLNLASGTLPPGLTMNSSGMISGTPTAAGTYNFMVNASDSCSAGAQQVQQTFSLVINPPTVNLTIIPPSLRIERKTAWTQNILYNFTSLSSAPISLTSAQGVFTANNTPIGQDNTPLNVTINNGMGTVTETLNIPVAISERAAELDTARIIYTRMFTSAAGGPPVTGQMEITVTTGATADFKITRLQLYFDNRRAEITVKRNQPSLKAYADIRFSGKGLLTGFWEVDGRILQHVNQHLNYGKSITLSSPEVPALPTFSPGTHFVRFVITQFLGDIPIPEGIYFVTADESSEVHTIGLVMPEANAQVAYQPITFGWKNKPGAVTYLIAFYGKDMEQQVFSAYTRKNSYQLPPAFFASLFAADGMYQWQVRGYDANGNIVGESPLNKFSFLK